MATVVVNLQPPTLSLTIPVGLEQFRSERYEASSIIAPSHSHCCCDVEEVVSTGVGMNVRRQSTRRHAAGSTVPVVSHETHFVTLSGCRQKSPHCFTKRLRNQGLQLKVRLQRGRGCIQPLRPALSDSDLTPAKLPHRRCQASELRVHVAC